MQNKNNGHGGVRPGAGREALPEEYEEKRIKLYSRLLEKLKDRGLNKQLSKYINALIESDINKNPT